MQSAKSGQSVVIADYNLMRVATGAIEIFEFAIPRLPVRGIVSLWGLGTLRHRGYSGVVICARSKELPEKDSGIIARFYINFPYLVYFRI